MADFETLVYLRETDVIAYLRETLARYGYGDPAEDGSYLAVMPEFIAAPPDDQSLKTPGALVFVNVGGGPGLSKESSFERLLITTRCVGEQSDFEGAKNLAMAVDRAFLSLGEGEMLGAVYALGITRTGGAPSVLMRDSAERYHFPCSYITEADTGL